LTLHTWLAFSIAAGIVLVIPGPTILAVISHSLVHGRRAVIPLVIGVTLGDFVAMSLSLLGLGAILNTSATLFSTLRLIGAIYLIYLGVRLWQTNQKVYESIPLSGIVSNKYVARNLFFTTVLNPKSIAFFIAFLPQFIDPAAPVVPQLLVLGGTFLVLAAVNAALYAFLAGHLRERVQGAETRLWLTRLGGSALIGTGIFTASMRRSA